MRTMPDAGWISDADAVAIHGLGREGRSALQWTRAHNPDATITVLDDHEPAAADRRLVADASAGLVVGSDHAAEVVAGADVVVRSAGVPPSHPGQVAARAADVPITTALNLFFAHHRPDNVIAITATKGKSTTATLVGHLLGSLGRRVRVAGNVGLSVLDLDVAPDTLDHLVLELSSYQLSDLRGRIAIGAWLNLHRDHLDWHGGVDGYVAAKTRIATLAHHLVVNGADDRVMASTDGHPARTTFDASGDPVVIGDRDVARDSLARALADSRMVGAHNLANLAAALAIGGLVGAGANRMLDGVATFTPLHHRLELVHRDGRRWINDSIATIPEAAVAALDAFPEDRVTLITGGHERGQDHAPLRTALARRATGPACVAVIALPDTGHRLADELATDQPAVDVATVPTLADAVERAADVTPAGGVVVLSPAAASFNQFRSFEDRGDTFTRMAREFRGTRP